jgi:hypothetical protein
MEQPASRHAKKTQAPLRTAAKLFMNDFPEKGLLQRAPVRCHATQAKRATGSARPKLLLRQPAEFCAYTAWHAIPQSRDAISICDKGWEEMTAFFLARNALPATAFFSIPGNRLIELGAQVEI